MTSTRAQPSFTSFSKSSTPCLYCAERLRGESAHLEHRGEHHPGLDFGCGACPFASPGAGQVARHLALAHGFDGVVKADMVALAGVTKRKHPVGTKLMQMFVCVTFEGRHLARLASDLRGLRCRLCSRLFLCQDRVDLRSHVQRCHGDDRVALHALRYECRICEAEFGRTEEFLAHTCCQANGQSRY